MTVSNIWCRRTLVRLTLIVVLAVFASACGSAPRPTLTTDRLPASATEPSDAAASPLEQDATDANSAAAPQQSTENPEAPQDPAGEAAAGGIEFLRVEVLEEFPHDTTAFTQGLEFRDGLFIESTGLYGESTLRRVQPFTGEVLESVAIEDQFFAEGLTQVGDELIQLTWRENTAFFWDAETFTRTREVSYEGEGWGICYDGGRLVMTDGTPVLIFRDAASFDEIGRINVTFDGRELANLNEVECVDGDVWANIWQTNEIVRIDPTTGDVTAIVDANSLNPATDAAGAVLNGIAWDESTQSFFITGKLWPTMYQVNFVPAG